MADIPLGSTVAPGGPFEIARDTDIKGGVHVVADAAARDAIIASRKKVGMFAVTQDDNKLWQLTSTGPDVWTEFTGGGGEADWQTETPRFFALDYDGGNDANAGFSDVSMAAAGLVPKKTWEGLQAIIPRIGALRSLEISIKPRAAGATYRNAANTADAVLDIRGYIGYLSFTIRGTDTNTTASSVAFAGDINDQILLGARLVAGTDTLGYKLTKQTTPVLGASNTGPVSIEHDGTTITDFAPGQKIFISGSPFFGFDDESSEDLSYIRQIWTIYDVPDSTHIRLTNSDASTFRTWPFGGTIERVKVTPNSGPASLAAEPGLINKRIRGGTDVVTNPTAASRNAVRQILANGTDTVVLDSDPSGVAGLDTFYIEEPNAAFASVQTGDVTALLGIRTTGTLSAGASANTGSLAVSFCQIAGAMTVTDRTIGTSRLFVGGLLTCSDCRSVTIGATTRSAGLSLNRVLSYTIGAACYFNGRIDLQSCGTAGSGTTNFALSNNVTIGSSSGTTTRPIRIAAPGASSTNKGNITAINSHGYISMVQFEGQLSCLHFIGAGSTWLLRLMADQRPGGGVGGSGGIQHPGLLSTTGASATIWFVDRTVVFRGPNASENTDWLFGEIFICHILSGFPPGPDGGAAFRSTDIDLADIKDQELCRIFTAHGPQGEGYGDRAITLANPTTYHYAEGSAVDLERFHLVRVASPGLVIQALADTVANASAIVGIGTTYSLGSPPNQRNTFVPVVSSGLCWVKTDVLVTLNDMLYLSTANPGQAMNTPPVDNGTNAKLRLGYALATTTHMGKTYARIDVGRMEMLPVLADGNA